MTEKKIQLTITKTYDKNTTAEVFASAVVFWLLFRVNLFELVKNVFAYVIKLNLTFLLQRYADKCIIYCRIIIFIVERSVMMNKKIIAFLLVVIMVLCVGCGKKNVITETEPATTAPTETVVEKEYYVNPLTGVKEFENQSISKRRPVAIMVNNLSTAQRVQTGVGEADIVYETEVEGGITRLLAVYQDVDKVERIGTVRSARYAYIDLAMGHNAVYIHHGADNVYAGPHLNDVDRIEINSGKYGQRVSNGLSYEHTLYTYGDSLWEGIKSTFETKNDSVEMWQNFVSEDEAVIPTEGTANSVNVPFSTSYQTKFVYDEDTGLYVRNFNSTVPTDYLTGEETKVKNVVVLLTSIGYYSNGKHRQISLNSGSGFYVTNGGYQKINWSKGNASSPFVFTNTDGTELEMNAGNTWVCIASSSYSYPSFK